LVSLQIFATKTSEAFSPGHGASGAGAAKFGTLVLQQKSENMVEIYWKSMETMEIYWKSMAKSMEIYGKKRETMEICKETCFHKLDFIGFTDGSP
jgi:hypothetical protein